MFVTNGTYSAAAAADPNICPTVAGWGNLSPQDKYTWTQLIRRAGVNSVSAPATTTITAMPGDRWADLDGNLLFSSVADLASNPPLTAITLAPYNQGIPVGEPVWTGMPPAAVAKQQIRNAPLQGLCTSGLAEQNPFQIWSSGDTNNFGYTGAVGAKDLSWLGGNTLPCSETAHIYCIEVRK